MTTTHKSHMDHGSWHHHVLLIGVLLIIILQIVILTRSPREKYAATTSAAPQHPMTPMKDHVALPPDQYILPNRSGLHAAFVLPYTLEKGVKNFNPNDHYIENHNRANIDMTLYPEMKDYNYHHSTESKTNLFYGPWMKYLFLFNVHQKIVYLQNPAKVDIFVFTSVLDPSSFFVFVPIKKVKEDVWKLDWSSFEFPENTRHQTNYITILIRGVHKDFDGLLPPFYISENSHPAWQLDA